MKTTNEPNEFELIVIGAGIAGMAIATRLQSRGHRVLVLEAHGQVGGCAGFFRRRGFAFDVGATTLVDFEPEGVGGQWLAELGLQDLPMEKLPGYRAWLPDRTVHLYQSTEKWHPERLQKLGNSKQHKAFWKMLDRISDTFWSVSRSNIKLPLRRLSDIWKASSIVPWQRWGMVRYLRWTMEDALRHHGLEQDHVLRGLLGMLIQDTVHSDLTHAPLINSALGVTIRGAGLSRATGGMYGFWKRIRKRFNELGGTLQVGRRVESFEHQNNRYHVHTRHGSYHAPQLISTLPIWNTAQLGFPLVQERLQPYMKRDENDLGGALVMFLGVPEHEVEDQPWTHHQILLDYHTPLGDGNNMFISVSAPGDTESAPQGHRAVMLSTHCELHHWENLSEQDYQHKKQALSHTLLQAARQVYPKLGEHAVLQWLGTPRTYQKYTLRHRGAVGGVKQDLRNSNQAAVPYDLNIPGFWQAGDTTWPGLGTVACVLASQHVAQNASLYHQKHHA